jgi:hypothetical protein
MSENLDEATGPSGSSEFLYGNDHELASAGFKPMPDVEKRKAAEFENVKEAAEVLAASRAGTPEIIEKRYLDEAGEPVDPSEAISVERAARDLTAMRNVDTDSGAKSISADFAAAVDRMRADVIKGDPRLAEQYGIEIPAATDGDKTDKAEGKTDALAALKNAGPPSGEFDEQLEAALSHPQVKAALEAQIGEFEKVR